MTPASIRLPQEHNPATARTIRIAAMSVMVAIGAALAAEFLTALIGLVTNLAFYGRVSTALVSPAGGHRQAFALVLVPILGALIVGIMARYGSAAIRGHGIPEVMERILFGESRISGRLLFLKPLSAAVAIGTGGPFGAEGPIIATGGALGSLLGQFMHVTSDERKVLLAAGAAAGMTATFGTPVSAVLLAVELLLFEYRPRSLIPVALASATAAGVRIAFHGTAPAFVITTLTPASGAALVGYAVLGVVVGVVAACVTRVSYLIEDAFERLGHRLNIHWMWWPLAGALVVGIVGLIEPRTLGVGYENITGAIAGTIAGRALVILVVLKFISWSIYLGSGTSGGTLAPLFTIGSGIGAVLGAETVAFAPSLGVNPHMAGLVGMAAMFAGASHALLTSIIFAFETTDQLPGILPLLIGCTAAYLVSLLISRNSIMTEKLARRGTTIRAEYSADHLAHVLVRDAATTDVVTVDAAARIGTVRAWLAAGAGGTTHQGFPVVDGGGGLLGIITRGDILDPAHHADAAVSSIVRDEIIAVYPESTLRDAADQMTIAAVGRLPVVQRDDPTRIVGIISRSDLLSAHAERLDAAHRVHRLRSFEFLDR